MNGVPEEDRETAQALWDATAGQNEDVALYLMKHRGVLPFTEAGREVLISALNHYRDFTDAEGWDGDTVECDLMLDALDRL